MRDRYGIFALAPEQQEVVSAGDRAAGRVLDDALVGERLGHRPVSDGERFFPDVVARHVPEAEALVEADDVPRKIGQVVTATRVAHRDVHRMNRSHPPWHRQSVEFAHDELVVLEELRVVPAVR
jgi:hypothetical protein